MSQFGRLERLGWRYFYCGGEVGYITDELSELHGIVAGTSLLCLKLEASGQRENFLFVYFEYLLLSDKSILNVSIFR